MFLVIISPAFLLLAAPSFVHQLLAVRRFRDAAVSMMLAFSRWVGRMAPEGSQERHAHTLSRLRDAPVRRGDWEERELLAAPFPHVLIASGRTTAPVRA